MTPEELKRGNELQNKKKSLFESIEAWKDGFGGIPKEEAVKLVNIYRTIRNNPTPTPVILADSIHGVDISMVKN